MRLQSAVAGVHEHEAARAVGVFGHARTKAGLAKQGALLVARHPADGDGVAQQLGAHLTKLGAGGLHLGQHGGRDAQGGQQLGVPLLGVDVEQQGARGVAHVGGVHRAAAQVPHEPGVDGAKQQLAALGLGAGVGHLVQNPLQFGARKVRVHQQTGFGLNGVGQALFAQGHAGRFGAAVLPNDGVVNGLAGAFVPHHRGFALVGDAHRRHLGGADAGFGQGLLRGGQLGLPNLHRVVFDPARLGVDLGDLLLRHGHDLALGVEHNAARAGGALVEREEVGHGFIQP